ncbi:PDR/VanB family oxidoreductase [uncultured Microbacterium sp.]|uniref:PDR/VanB family oxidoreductase n=1 Tax=uncultured Microbacterium sp. TaxID=191216 RepID=UPI0035CB608F
MKIAPAEIDTVVESRSLVAEDALRLDLVRADGGVFPTWDPGAHIDVLLPSGIERQYSLCGSPEQQRTWTIVVLREPSGRGGSLWLHEQVELGTALRVRGPSNHFALDSALRYRLIAGGIGITAILPMIRSLESRGAAWELDYAARSAHRMAFRDEVRALGGERARMHVTAEGARLDLDALRPEPGELVYACGPARLLDALTERSADWEPGSLRIERFEAVRSTEPVQNQPITVDLVLAGQTIDVGAQESILDAVEREGIFVLSSCREGTCGTCETVVVGGTVEHRDSILTEAERRANDRMMICVSRASSSHLALEL